MSKYVLTYIEPFVLLWLRYAVACIVLFVILRLVKSDTVEKADLPLFAWLGFIGYFVSNGSGFIGTHLSNAHMATLISASSSIFTILFACWLLKEKLPFIKIISALIAAAGVAVVIAFDTKEAGSSTVGNLFLLCDAVSWGLYSVYLKKVPVKYSALIVSAYATFAALVLTTPLMLWQVDANLFEQLQKTNIWVGILFLGVISTAVAFFLWNKGMEYVEAGFGTMFYFITPLIGSVLGWLVLHERLQWNFFLGGLLIMVGLAVASRRQRPAKLEESPA